MSNLSDVNYSLQYTVSEVAKMLDVKSDVVKTWAYKFSHYLSSGANPGKGKERRFEFSDLRVLAYVFMQWDGKDIDVEETKWGLNSNQHYDNDLIERFLADTKPIFTDPPENVEETANYGVLYGGMAEVADMFFLANAFKQAGDFLIDGALENEVTWKLFCPALYNYRHAVELYLKAFIPAELHQKSDGRDGHNLARLFSEFKKEFAVQFNQEIPNWFEQVVSVLHDFDPGGVNFRYGGNVPGGGEIFVDFPHMKDRMNRFSKACQTIRQAQGMLDAVS